MESTVSEGPTALAFQQELDAAQTLMEQERVTAHERPAQAPQTTPKAGTEPVLVLEPEERSFTSSLTAALRANDLGVQTDHTLDEAAVAAGLDRAGLHVLVIDLREDAEETMTWLEPLLGGDRDPPPFTVAVGPGDDIETMSRAIGVGFSDYVPRSAVAARLPKVVKRLVKRAAKKLG